MNNYLVLDWMTPHPITITPKTSLAEAHRTMKDRHVRRLPVIDNGKLVGIVTLGDLRAAEPSQATMLSIFEINYLLDTMPIEKVMTKRVITVSPKTRIREAAGMMLLHKISGLPVVDGEKLVGMLTESDIFRMLVRELAGEPVA